MQNKQFYTQLDICQESALLTWLRGPRYMTSSMDTKFTVHEADVVVHLTVVQHALHNTESLD